MRIGKIEWDGLNYNTIKEKNNVKDSIKRGDLGPIYNNKKELEKKANKIAENILVNIEERFEGIFIGINQRDDIKKLYVQLIVQEFEK